MIVVFILLCFSSSVLVSGLGEQCPKFQRLKHVQTSLKTQPKMRLLKILGGSSLEDSRYQLQIIGPLPFPRTRRQKKRRQPKWMFPKNRGTSKSSHFNRAFPLFSPSILGENFLYLETSNSTLQPFGCHFRHCQPATFKVFQFEGGPRTSDGSPEIEKKEARKKGAPPLKLR